MIGALVAFARFFLVLQVIAGTVVLAGVLTMQLMVGNASPWQIAATVAVGVGLLASAGFAAVLFQISDHLAELVAQGRQRGAGAPDATGRSRREPTIGVVR